MKRQHPNKARATRAAARSGVSVKSLGTYPPDQRQAILAALNTGELALINSPAGQFIVPATPAETSQ